MESGTTTIRTVSDTREVVPPEAIHLRKAIEQLNIAVECIEHKNIPENWGLPVPVVLETTHKNIEREEDREKESNRTSTSTPPPPTSGKYIHFVVIHLLFYIVLYVYALYIHMYYSLTPYCCTLYIFRVNLSTIIHCTLFICTLNSQGPLLQLKLPLGLMGTSSNCMLYVVTNIDLKV